MSITPDQRALILAAVERAGSRRKLAFALGLGNCVVSQWLGHRYDLTPEREAMLRAWLAAPHVTVPDRPRGPPASGYRPERHPITEAHAIVILDAAAACDGMTGLASILGINVGSVQGYAAMRTGVPVEVLARCRQIAAEGPARDLVWRRVAPLAIVRAVVGEPETETAGVMAARRIRRGVLDALERARWDELVAVVARAERERPSARAEHYMRTGGEAW